MSIWHVVYHWTGVGHGGQPNTAYSFWSGIAGELGFPVAIAVWWQHNACHGKGCWRLGKHPVEGTPYKTCRRHHPTVPDVVTLAHIHQAHRAAKEEA